MSDHGHVRITQLPSRASQVWIDAIRSACEDAGWDFHFQEWGQANPALAPGRGSVVMAWWNIAPESPPLEWIVQSASPPEVEAALLASGMSPHDARHEAALRLVAAGEVLRAGGRLVQASDAWIEIPGLGRIERERIDGEFLPHDALHPLSICSVQPELRPSSVRWAPDLFVYHDAALSSPGVIPLLGRRRLLLNGPNIALPVGSWTMEAEFSVRPEPVADLFIEWGHGHETAKAQEVLRRPGRYRLEMTHEWAAVAPADFRISLMMPALDGLLEFHGGRLTAGSPDWLSQSRT